MVGGCDGGVRFERFWEGGVTGGGELMTFEECSAL